MIKSRPGMTVEEYERYKEMIREHCRMMSQEVGKVEQLMNTKMRDSNTRAVKLWLMVIIANLAFACNSRFQGALALINLALAILCSIILVGFVLSVKRDREIVTKMRSRFDKEIEDDECEERFGRDGEGSQRGPIDN
jgi:uncharacterized protein YacL